MSTSLFSLRLRLTLLLLLLAPLAQAQPTAQELVQGVYARMAQQAEYRAHVDIDADIPMLKMPAVEADIHFIQPDELKITSKSLAVLPRQGFADFRSILSGKDDFTAVFSGEEEIDGRATRLVSLIPTSMEMDLVLAKLWIDPARQLVLRAQLTYRSSGTMLVDFTYGAQATYGLPDQMVFTLDIRQMKIPKAMTADLHKKKSPEAAADADRPARITIRFSNYRWQ